MNTLRNRWLLLALGLVAVVFFGDMGYRKLYEQPAADRERSKEQLEKRLDSAKLELAEAKLASRQLEELELKSLPWDAEMARSRYQAWLLQLTTDAKLLNTSVDSGDPVSITRTDRKTKRSVEMYKKFTFSVRGRGDLGQVTRFLYDFYRGGHLHKIRSMSLNPIGAGQQIDLSVSIEALALPDADREAELTTLVSEDLAQTNVRDYQFISRRNFFGQGGAASAWKDIELTAVTFDVHGVGEAWFKVGAERETRILPVGQVLAMPSFDLRVVKLDEVEAIVDVDGQLLRMAIGQSLADATPVTDLPAPLPPAE